MKGFTLIGKRNFSTDYLKKVLNDLLGYEPTIISDESNNLSFKCHFYINSKDNLDLIDIIHVLKNCCSYFKLEIDDDMYYDNTSSPYYLVSEYYHWDGKNLKRCFRDYFGSRCEVVNYLLK